MAFFRAEKRFSGESGVNQTFPRLELKLKLKLKLKLN
jgi:hypothetical protein